jgi:hypothetical protein
MIQINVMQKRVRMYFLSFVAASILLVISTASSVDKKPKHEAPTVAPAANGFAVVELFTSQGCSSCPPADALLGQYVMANDTLVLPIAFHVDYWNRLGWKDPFSNPLYSQRQQGYAALFKRDGVYTPQAVVNGTRQMVGSDARLLNIAIAQAKTTAPTVTVNISAIQQKKDAILIDYTLAGAYNDATLQAVLIQQQVQTQIKAGENSGLSLSNYHIARDLNSQPATASGQVQLLMPTTDAEGKYKVVLFVQQSDGKITGVAQGKVNNEE